MSNQQEMELERQRAAIRATAEREFATYRIEPQGTRDDKVYGWRVSDAAGADEVTYDKMLRKWGCTCRASQIPGGAGTCVHQEIVRIYGERRKAEEAAARAANQAEQPTPAPDGPPAEEPPTRTTPAPAHHSPAAPDPRASDERLLALLGVIAGTNDRIAAQLERCAGALEALVRYQAPKAPNYRRPLTEWAGFDWESIGAEVVTRDRDGVAVVKWGDFTWTRRAPDNKFGEAVWYSRPDGRDADGNMHYVRLITFVAATEAEPVGRKVAGKLAGPSMQQEEPCYSRS